MKVDFYLADDIRPLADGKLVMLGVYTDRVVVAFLPPGFENGAGDDRKITLSGLSVLFTIKGLSQGRRATLPKIVNPDGQERAPALPSLDFEVDMEGQAINLMMRFQPFTVTEPGIHWLSIQVDGEEVAMDFEIRFASTPTI